MSSQEKPDFDFENNTLQLFLKGLRDQYARISDWFKPNPDDKSIMRLLKILGKVLLIIVTILLSPIILLTLIFVFFAAL